MAKWLDPSERCRELARRERDIYDQQELPDLLEHMAEENARLRAEAANSAAQRDAAEKRAEVAEERLRAADRYAATLRRECREAVMQELAALGQAQEAYEAQLAAEAELARIRAADRTSITVRTTEAAKMRKGQAI